MRATAIIPKSEATIERILAAAESLFLQRNYAEVTMDQIAAESEVTKGGLYHHFASKEDLYLAMMHRDLQAKRELFEAAIARPGDSRARLRALTKAFLDLPQAKRDLISLVRRDINVFAEPLRTELIRAYQAALPRPVAEVIDDGIRTGEITVANARLLSWQFVAMVEVALSEYADEVFGDTEAKLDYVLDLFFNGAGVGPQKAPGVA